MKKAGKRIYKRKLSGFRRILLIILTGTAKKLKFVRNLKGGEHKRSQEIGRFWDQ